MGRLAKTGMETATYDQCVFAVADGLNAKHGERATFLAAEFVERAQGEGDSFGINFWRDVIRAIEAGDRTGPCAVN